MWRLYVRRWRFTALALLLGLGTVAAVAVMAEPIAVRHARTPHARAEAAVTGDGYAAGPLPDRRGPHSDAAFAKRGLQLMMQAAVACQTVAYQGLQLVLWRNGSRLSSYLIDLWHQPGAPAVAQNIEIFSGSSAGATSSGTQDANVSDSDALAITAARLRLMAANFTLEYQGNGTADFRPAAIVDLVDSTGAVAATYWVDDATKLPIRREMFDQAGDVVNDDAFVKLSAGRGSIGAAPAARSVPPGAALSRSGIGALRRHGWPVPASLGGRLGMVTATATATAAGPLVDAYYSDGLSGVSLFLQPGELPARLAGWQAVGVDGHVVFASAPAQRTLSWSASGYVYTVIADAPPQTVRLVVDELPHERAPGVLQRMRRGLVRIISWVNPFR